MMRKLTILLMLPAVASIAQAQETRTASTGKQGAPRPTPASAKSKVWTNESVHELRKPWDDYADQKVVSEEFNKKIVAGPKAPTATDKVAEGVAAPVFEKPKTIAETDQRISEKEEEIRYHETSIHTVQQQLEIAPPEGRERLQGNLNRIKSLLEAANRDLKALQAARQELSPAASSLNPY